MAQSADIKRFRENFQGEVDAAATYREMERMEAQPHIKEVYARMAAIEEKHVDFWAHKLEAAGIEAPARRPTGRARIMMWLARRFGSGLILPTLVDTEQNASHTYDTQPEAKGTGIIGEEQSHARVLKAVSQASRNTGMEGGMLARMEGRHRAVGGNALRAAVLGANDGLVSTLSLVMGVAGGSKDAKTVALAGMAGMLAGACAMAMGEWLSVQSARELAQKQLSIESAELTEAPEEEMEELALIYQSKGLPKGEARSLAVKLIADKDTALDTLAREELGIDPAELGGNAWEAAIASFVLFFVGAVAPALPFLFVTNIHSGIILSLSCSAVALILLGFMTHLMTGRGLWFSGIRALIIGMLAAGVTYGMGAAIGHFFGITVAG
jgi:vacuolar iron transporter family protein